MASKKNKGWYIIIGMILFLIIIASWMPKPADWSISLKKDDKIPYGSYILGKEMTQLFSNDSLIFSDEPAYNTIKSLDSNAHYNYFILAKNPEFSDLDLEKLYWFLEHGNHVFISANDFPQALLDTLHLNLNGFSIHMLRKEQLTQKYWQFNDSNLQKYNDSITTRAYGNSFFNTVSDTATIIGKTDTKPVFLEVPFGEGKLFLHTQPLIFTNYFLLSKHTSVIASVCLSHLPNQTTIFDNYYQKRKSQEEISPFQEIFKRPSLRWAYYLFFFGILLYMFFHAKRNQRIIPIIRPHKNESVGFVKTVGDLLFQNSNNKSIVEKKIKYFKQHIASKYNQHEANLSKIDQEILAEKSGHSKDFIAQLIKTMQELNQKSVVPHERLMKFTKELNKFYNRD